MHNIQNEKIVLATILVLLMFSSIYLYTTPDAQAAEISATQKGISILNDVLGVNVEEYNITSTARQDSFLEAPEEKVYYTLNSSTSNLKFLCTFANDQLTRLHVLEREGSPIMTKSTDNLLDATKDFLTSYQQYLGNTLYGELRSMLGEVDTLKNSTITSGSTKLEVTNTETIKGFTWSYTYNGIEAASKCIIISYENGFLKYFIDNWNLYRVGSTDVNLSEKQAIEIAYENAKKHSWKVNIDNTTMVEINNFNLTDVAVKQLVFCNSHNADNPHDADTLTLYPMWRIGINLDKFYPGNVYGLYVDIWADTKQVRAIQEAFTTLDPEFYSNIGTPFDKIATIEESSIEKSQLSSSLSTATFLLFPIVFIFGTMGILLYLRNKGLYYLSSKHSHRIAMLLICFLMLFSTIASSISSADAMHKGRATIWGSTVQPKTAGELTHQDLICSIIDGRFDANGYSSLDQQGPSTNEANFLNKMSFGESATYRHVTVWFDHGVGQGLNFPNHPNEWHFMLKDSNNNNVFDFEIFGNTQGRTKFALINTCLSAKTDLLYLSHWPGWYPGRVLGAGNYGSYGNYEEIGMPYAFTHDASLGVNPGGGRVDNYLNPDTSKSFCYIGFSAGSASLEQETDPNIGYIKHYDFLWEFFNSSLYYDLTIKDALDDATQSCWPNYAGYGGTKLHNGFTAIWWGLTTYWGDHDHMEVYGNSIMRLHQPTLTLSATGGANPTFSLELQSGGATDYYLSGTHNIIPGSYKITIPDVPGYTYLGATYNGNSIGRPFYFQIGPQDGQLVAYYAPASPYISVSATADVAATASQYYTAGSSPTISWQCADDYGAYYCYLTEVIVDGVSHNPSDYGSVHAGSITFNNIQSDHSVVVHSAPYYYPVTFNQYAHDDNYGDILVNSWTEYRVAWEERDGPVYSHGSDLHGGGPVSTYVDSSITDPWGYGSDDFSYAVAHNWGGGSESYYYSIPMDIWTFTWGNTVDIYYEHAPQTYMTTVNVWVTYDGYYYYSQGSYNIYEPAGSNYLDFGDNFIQAYNYYDSSGHYVNPDWYNLGTGTTIDVGYWGY